VRIEVCPHNVIRVGVVPLHVGEGVGGEEAELRVGYTSPAVLRATVEDAQHLTVTTNTHNT
jgi:hypothetical protein